MNARGAPGDRLARLRDEDLVADAADAAGLDEEGREGLQRLAEGLRSVPDAEASALLLRELDGLTYEEIAQLAGVTSPGARQAVYRARLGLQGNPAPATPHCDEVRVAMSKAETSVRDRRSITAHLDHCPVCADFADALERRPEQLATLFGEETGGAGERAAELLAAGAVGAGMGAGGVEVAEALDEPATGTGPAAGTNGHGPAAPPRRRRSPDAAPPRRARRSAVAPLALLALLAGGGVALAIALSSGGGGKPSHVTARATPPTGQTGPQTASAAPASKRHGVAPVARKPKNAPAKAARPAGGKNAGRKPAAAKSAKRRASAAGAAGAAGAAAAGAGTARAAGGSSGSGSSGASTAGQGSATGAGTQGAGGSQLLGSTSVERESSAQAGYSSGAGNVEQEVHGGLPSTGLQIGLVVAAAVLLLGLGLTLRRLTRSRA
ncbi:MAG: hypothetical protein JOZ25_05960 [Actinobacteria bacterium]|nr:hypothetical protein [Actinomycetota bacterium]